MFSTRSVFNQYSTLLLFNKIKKSKNEINLWETGKKVIANSKNNSPLMEKIANKSSHFQVFQTYLKRNSTYPEISHATADKIYNFTLNNENKSYFTTLSRHEFTEEEKNTLGKDLWLANFKSLNNIIKIEDIKFKINPFKTFLNSLSSSNIEIIHFSNVEVENNNKSLWISLLLESINRNLEELSITNCQLNNDAAFIIANAIDKNTLKTHYLTLHKNNIENQGALQLVASLIKQNYGTTIDLSKNLLTREGIKDIRNLGITCIDVNFNHNYRE